jgi:purine-nucleoside phosphorylase
MCPRGLTGCLKLAGKPTQLPVTQVVSHEEVLEVGREKANVMKQLVERIVDLISS